MPPPPGRLTSRIELPLDRDHVFSFFSDAANLGLITPPELHLRIRSAVPVRMHEGTLIDYAITLWGFPIRWRSRITKWDPPNAFVDEQVRGPYRSWVHTHRFSSIPGGTLIEDDVSYTLRFGWLGALAAPLVRRQLDRVFVFRGERVRQLLVAGAEWGDKSQIS